ncbi:MAG: hypothetical protein MJ106_00720, partial [Lentisphaeria bacterium]|nr:hypothetical protein [Lentisphaeria bacterium]
NNAPQQAENNNAPQQAENNNDPQQVNNQEGNPQGENRPETLEQKQQRLAKCNERLSELREKFNMASNKLASRNDIMRNDPRFRASEMQAKKAFSRNDIGNALGAMGQNIVKGVADLYQSKATAMGADQARENERLEQAKDLINNLQDSIRDAKQRMGEALSADSQNMEGIIRNC